MQRYFHTKFEDIITLDENNSKHIVKVMRNNIGDEIHVCIENNYYKYKIIDIESKVRAELIENLSINNELDRKVTCVIPILKKDNHKIAIQKSIELGVDEIILYQGDNTVVKWNNPDKKIEKIESFVYDACRQSFRNKVVEVKFEKLKNINLNEFDVKLYGDETKNKVNHFNDKNSKIIFISGCEGGFSKSEYDFFEKNDIQSFSLAKTILRAETAPITFCSIINYIK